MWVCDRWISDCLLEDLKVWLIIIWLYMIWAGMGECLDAGLWNYIGCVCVMTLNGGIRKWMVWLNERGMVVWGILWFVRVVILYDEWMIQVYMSVFWMNEWRLDLGMSNMCRINEIVWEDWCVFLRVMWFCSGCH